MWHAMADSYMEPDVFRMHLNSLIQAMRNVTFMVQKQKLELTGYDEWYNHFVKTVGPKPLMRWAVKSRNRVVKESDLDLLSEFKIRWVADWGVKRERTLTFPPRLSSRDMMAILFSDPGNPRVGVLSLSRRWVDKALPDYELLQATREVYIELCKLLHSAHEAASVPLCALDVRDPSCVVPKIDVAPLVCMDINSNARQEHLDLSDGSGIREITYEVAREESRVVKAKKRYGDFKVTASDPIEAAPQLMETARIVLAKDKRHMHMVWFYRDGKVIDMLSPNFADQAGKLLTFHRLADRVESLRADGIAFVAEAWWAPDEVRDSQGAIIPPRDRKDRQEVLTVAALTRDGRCISLLAPFSKTILGKIVIEETVTDTDLRMLGGFGPVVDRWKQMDDRGEA